MFYFGSGQYPTAKQIHEEQEEQCMSSAISAAEAILKLLGASSDDVSDIHAFDEKIGRLVGISGSDSPIEGFSDLAAFTPDGRAHPFAYRLKKAYPKPEFKIEALQNKKQQNVDEGESLEYYKSQCAHLSELLASVCELDPSFYIKDDNNYYRLLEFHGPLFSWYTEYQLQNQSARRKANIEHYSAQFETLSDDGVMELVDKGILKDVYEAS